MVQNALNVASTADPLQQVKVTTFIGYTYNATASTEKKLDETQLGIMNAVAGSLFRPIRKPISPTKEIISVAWSFEETEENYAKYIKPWAVSTLYFSDKLPEELKIRQDGGGYKVKESIKPWKKFFAESMCLTEVGYNILIGSFHDWCIPKLAVVWATVAKDVVKARGSADDFSKIVVDVDV